MRGKVGIGLAMEGKKGDHPRVCGEKSVWLVCTT